MTDIQERPDQEHASAESGENNQIRSRRHLLTLAGAAAAGGAALALGQASPAGAAAGDPLILGQSNSAGNSDTSITSSSAGTTLGVNNSNTSAVAKLYVTGNTGTTDVKLAGSGRIQQFSAPGAGATRPTANPSGFELARGTGHAIWASAATNSWKRMNTLRVDNPNGNGSPFTPFRLIDTRNAEGAITLQGARARNSTTHLNVAGVAQLPANTRAVVGHITVTSATGQGFITLWPRGVTRPAVATTNFPAGTVVNNAFTVGLNNDGEMSLFVGGGSSFTVQVIIDITAYVQ